MSRLQKTLVTLMTGASHKDLESIVPIMAQFFLFNPNIWVAILSSMIDKRPDFQQVALWNLISFKDVQFAVDRMNMQMRHSLNISRLKWTQRVRPLFQNLTNALIPPRVTPGLRGPRARSGLYFIRGTSLLERDYKESTQYYAPQMQIGHTLDGDQVNLNAVHYSMFKLLILHLSTPSIRKSMHWLRIARDDILQTRPILVSDHCIIIKICRDGFVLSMGRSMEMTIMINCSVRGLHNSKQHADVVSLASCEENSYNLYMLSQQVDKEAFALSAFGVPDPESGHLIKIISLSIEDSVSAQYGFGRAKSSSNWRWLWSKFGVEQHWHSWTKYKLPFTVTSKWHSREWKKFNNGRFDTYCRRMGLDKKWAVFQGSDQLKGWKQFMREYKSAQNYINTEAAHGQKSDWLRGVDFLGAPMDPFHCQMRDWMLLGKHLALALMDYHLWIMDEANVEQRRRFHGDYADGMVAMSQSQILVHFREHVQLKMYFNEKIPAMSKVHARMSIIFKVCVPCSVLICPLQILL